MAEVEDCGWKVMELMGREGVPSGEKMVKRLFQAVRKVFQVNSEEDISMSECDLFCFEVFWIRQLQVLFQKMKDYKV